MVTIKYYRDINTKPEVFQCERVIDFIQPRFKTRDELLDLRFFDNDILSHEIDQSTGEFLDINEGTVAIIHDSMIPRYEYAGYIIYAIVVAVAVVVLTPDPVIPDTSRDQQSGTNTLGDSVNEPRINQRIDDIFGTVTKHMPSLWQVPYRIGVDNQETEVLLCCVGRGKYQIDPAEWYDGDTPVENIPNAAVNIYGPDTNPNDDLPESVIGYNITEKIGVYRQSNDLNPSELQPPNALDNAGIEWSLTGSDNSPISVSLGAISIPDGFDFTEYYKVGDKIRLRGMYYIASPSNETLYVKGGTTSGGEFYGQVFETYDTVVDLGEDSTLEYEIYEVVDTFAGKGLTLYMSPTASSEVINAWSQMTSYKPPKFLSRLLVDTLLDTHTIDTTIRNNDWFILDPNQSPSPQYDVTVSGGDTAPYAGVLFENVIGPVFKPEKATEIILNFVSTSGFYKIENGNNVAVEADIQITFFEIDDNGDETGNFDTEIITYESNETSITQPVFKTVRLEPPYTRCKFIVERITNRDENSNISNVDIVEWRDFYSFEPISVDDFGDVTLAHVIIPSNSASRLIKQRKQNVTLTRKVTQYLGNGSFGPSENYATDRFDQILTHIALDPWNGRMELENINADGFIDIRNEIISYFGSDEMTRFGYVFDTTDMTFQDMYMLIADAVMCRPFVQAGVYDLFFEKAQTVSSMQVTCRNKIQGSEARRIDLDKENDGVELTYRDNETAVQETIYIPSDQSATNPMTLELKGVTSALQATRRANREYNKLKYELEYVQFDVDEFGRNIVPYKRIDSPDSTRFTKRADVDNGYRVYDGEVIEVNGLHVELSEPVEFIDSEDHYITFTKENGDNSEVIQCTQIDEFNVLLATIPAEPVYDGYSRDRTKYILVSEQLRESVALIPKTIDFNLSDDNVETHSIKLVNYTDNYYQNDLDELE